jgi:hypothetical protein
MALKKALLRMRDELAWIRLVAMDKNPRTKYA